MPPHDNGGSARPSSRNAVASGSSRVMVAKGLNRMVLDACRNNPLARSMQRTAATRTVSGGSFADLNEDLLGDETLVAYAAAAGTTAADGRGRNSPYTAALLSHLETPLEIGLLFRRVRAQVLAATNGGQRPHEYHSLVGEHYLTRTLATLSRRPGRRAPSYAGRGQTSCPMLLNLLTASAPRSLRAREPGALSAAIIACRSAS